MHKTSHVTLTDDERAQLHDLIHKGKTAARVQTHARILLKAKRAPAGPECTDAQISTALDVSRSTVERVRRTLVEAGMDAALYRRKPTATRSRKLDGELVDVQFPDAPRITLVLDNLNTHGLASLYKAFAPAEARRIWERLEVHDTPKHGSWLNMAEIELSVLSCQCLDQCIPDRETLTCEVAAWECEVAAWEAEGNSN